MQRPSQSHGKLLCEDTGPAADLFSVVRIYVDGMFTLKNAEFKAVDIIACVNITAPGAGFR